MDKLTERKQQITDALESLGFKVVEFSTYARKIAVDITGNKIPDGKRLPLLCGFPVSDMPDFRKVLAQYL